VAIGAAKATKDATGGPVPTTEQIVGIALGQFQPAFRGGLFHREEAPIVKIRTFSLFAFGGGSGPTICFSFSSIRNTPPLARGRSLRS